MNENLNPEHEEGRSSETGGSPPGQLDYRELFLDHVRKYDLDCIIASRGAGGKQQLLDELRKAADKIFGPLAGRIESPDSWVQSVWQQAQDYGYRLAVTTTARTAMDCGQVLQALSDQKQPSSMQFKWFFSNTLGYHWNIGRGGKGIKSVLAITGWDNANLADCRNKLNDAIDAIKSFQPSKDNCADFYKNLSAERQWQDYSDLSVLFHSVWPQFFPVHYIATEDGYSQSAGMQRLLTGIELQFGLTLKPINYSDYSDYSAAYRILLAIYDAFVNNPSDARHKPHFDFLTQLLAEREDEEAQQLLLIKKAVVLYGIPGTGKTHMAREELLPALVDQGHTSRVQFHAGYAYADFMIGIKPRTSASGSIRYDVEPGLLYCLAAEAANALRGHEEEFGDGSPLQEGDQDVDRRRPLRYALLIDEINRADLARVFGELLYCIEYRGSENSIDLPHTLVPDAIVKSVFTNEPIDDPFKGGRQFYLPHNLYLLGTMNQADRSIGAFDAALRRRFGWYRLDFSRTRMEEIVMKKCQGDVTLQKLADVSGRLVAFSQRAEHLNDLIADGRCTALDPRKPDEGLHALPLTAEHRIGHTWFAEIIGILKRFGHRDGRIESLHLDRLWLYFLQPQLEDALGFEAENFRHELEQLRAFFCRDLA